MHFLKAFYVFSMLSLPLHAGWKDDIKKQFTSIKVMNLSDKNWIIWGIPNDEDTPAALLGTVYAEGVPIVLDWSTRLQSVWFVQEGSLPKPDTSLGKMMANKFLSDLNTLSRNHPGKAFRIRLDQFLDQYGARAQHAGKKSEKEMNAYIKDGIKTFNGIELFITQYGWAEVDFRSILENLKNNYGQSITSNTTPSYTYYPKVKEYRAKLEALAKRVKASLVTNFGFQQPNLQQLIQAELDRVKDAHATEAEAKAAKEKAFGAPVIPKLPGMR